MLKIKLTDKVLEELGEKRMKELLKEFKKAYNTYSGMHAGHFAPGVIMKYAETKDGYWYWKGYRLNTFVNYLDKLKREKYDSKHKSKH